MQKTTHVFTKLHPEPSLSDEDLCVHVHDIMLNNSALPNNA